MATVIIDVNLNSADARQKAKDLANQLVELKDRQDVLKASGRQLGVEYKENAQQIQQLERATRAYIAISNAQNSSLVQLRAQLSLLTNQFDNLSAAERKNADVGGQLATQIQKVQKEITAAEQATGRFQRNVGNYAQNLTNYITGFLSLSAAISLVKKTFDAALETDAVRTSLGYILESTEVADVKLRELKETCEELGLDFVATSQAYNMFTGAAKASNFDLAESDRLFNSVSRVLGVLHVPASGATRAFYALQEMISMGTIQSRQLNRMLGLVIPGASKIMADAIGVTVAQLKEMERSGELLSSEVLPKFATQLDKAIAPGIDQIDSLQAAWNNLGNTFTESVDENGALNKFFKHIIVGFTNISKIVLGTINDISNSRWASLLERTIGTSSNADRINKLLDSYQNSIKEINSVPDVTSLTQEQATALFNQLKVVSDDALKAYLDYQKGIKDGSLKDAGNLDDYKNVSNLLVSRLTQLKSLYPQVIESAKSLKEINDADLKSIKEIRDRIADLSKLPGSAVAGDAIAKRITDLRNRLKELSGSDADERRRQAALERIAQDRAKSLLNEAALRLTVRQKEYADIDLDINKRKVLYEKYGQDTTRLEAERRSRIIQLTQRFNLIDMELIRKNVRDAANIRASLIIDPDQRKQAQLTNQTGTDLQDIDRTIAALAARVAMGEQGQADLLQSYVDSRNAIVAKATQDQLKLEEEKQDRLREIERNGNNAAIDEIFNQLKQEHDAKEARLQINEEIAQSYEQLTGSIAGLFNKQTTAGKVAFLAQKAFAIAQILINGEAAKAEIAYRYEVLKRQAVIASSIAGPAAPFVAIAAVAGLTAAEGVEIGAASVREAAGVGAVIASAIGGFAHGGLIQGAGNGTSDSIPIRVSNGESIMTAQATRMFGPMLSDMNVMGGGRPFATGGMVGGTYVPTLSNQVDSRNAISMAVAAGVRSVKVAVAVEDINYGQAKFAQLEDAGNW